MNNAQAIEGFFLSFDKNDMEDIRAALTANGYTPDTEGLKEAILDALLRDPPEVDPMESFIHKSKEYIKENPEKIRDGISLAFHLFKMVKNKVKV